jgi:nitrogenase iron protein NifH
VVEPRQLAIYGKGGIGKSTVASNLSIALRQRGITVMQVGCDPKRDSTRVLNHGRMIPTVLETLREELRMGRDEYAVNLDDVIYQAPSGVYCVESGGPEPGIGCAGRGVLTAIQMLRDLDAFSKWGVEVVIYDVLGDVVCGGFAQPIRQGYAREIYLVCTGEFMSLYAANNIARGIQRLAQEGEVGLAGVICNIRNEGGFEPALIAEFAETLGSRLVQVIPRSQEIMRCEVNGLTVVEGAPDSAAAASFRELAGRVMGDVPRVIPTPFSDLTELEDLYKRHLPPANRDLT